MDVESVVCRAVTDRCGFPCYHEVPADPPAEFAVAVRRGGGDVAGCIEAPTLVVSFRAATRKRAASMSAAAKDVLRRLPVTDPLVMGCEITGDYREDDPDTGQPRYKLAVTVTAK